MRLLSLALVLLAALAARPARAGPPDPGQVAFGQICADCHGLDARGDGPKGALLPVRPAVLTRLAARSGGVFPMLHVIGVIDGRDPVAEHPGPSPMPAFGTLVGGPSAALDTPGGTVLFTRGVILSIALYLETVQE